LCVGCEKGELREEELKVGSFVWEKVREGERSVRRVATFVGDITEGALFVRVRLRGDDRYGSEIVEENWRRYWSFEC
jgi:hypothetical protein